MKSIFLALSLLALAFASNHAELKVRYKFSEFIEKYDKKYSSTEEFGDKLMVFAQNLREIETHNAKEDKTWTKGINQFTDLTGYFFRKLNL